MNPELIKKIEQYELNSNSLKSTVEQFLNLSISKNLYIGVNGNSMEEKIETIYKYLNDINGSKEPKVKSVLNIVIADNSSSLEYVSYLNEMYDVTVHKAKDVKDATDIDLVLFTGGEDVTPSLYFEKVGRYTHINTTRDTKEIDTFHKFKGSSLLLGICRGNQLLTVLSGGKLIQHVEGHGRDHSILLKSGMRFNMTSSHHQMIYPFNLNEKHYELIAHSEYFQSHKYLNGDDEQIDLPKDFLEPEIVYYKNTDSLCIQGHPEWSHCDKRTATMCLNLIDKYLKEFKNSKEGIISNYYQTIDVTSSGIGWDDNHYEEDHNDYYEEGHEEQKSFL